MRDGRQRPTASHEAHQPPVSSLAITPSEAETEYDPRPKEGMTPHAVPVPKMPEASGATPNPNLGPKKKELRKCRLQCQWP
jgi:hypothetical protein